MSKPLVSDALWESIKPPLPPEPPKPKGGRPRVPDRAALTGILFVLKSGIPWEMLPPEMGCGSGVTCWRRLRDWQQAGVWARLHQSVLDRLGEADKIDWRRASVDSAFAPAKRGARKPGRIRRIAAKRAASAILWSTGRASRSPSSSPRPTAGRPQDGACCPLCRDPSDSARFSRPPFGRGKGAVHARPAPIDLVRLAQAVQDRLVQARPDACLLPVAQAPPAGHAAAAAHLRGQHLPGDAALEHEEDPRQSRAVGHAGPAAFRLGRLGR